MDAIKKFCDTLSEQVLADSRATKHEDSWVKVTQVLPSMVTVSCNFYCPSSGRIQREFTEDIIIIARSRGEECGLSFHEPRRGAQM